MTLRTGCFRSILALGLLAGSTAVASAAIPGVIPDATSPGREFVDLLVKGDFAAAEAQFDTTMKGAMPEDKLKQTWQALLAQVGAYQKTLRARNADQAGYKIVLVTCQFEKAAIDVRIVFNAGGQVSGLFFAPGTPDAGTFKTPANAKADTYQEKDFTVGTGEWALPGTLTMPKGGTSMPAVVLVHGSGPNDRDETIGSNKIFRDLAWGLASRGIAVVRYEKRTHQYAAKLAANLGGFTVKEESIDDAVAAAAQLRKTDGINPARVYVLGHSLGATVMPRIGQADPSLAGVILLAGATRPLEDLMVDQTKYLASLNGPLSKEDQAKVDALLADVAKVKKLTAADAASKETVLFAPPSYWLDLRSHDELAIAKALKMPMFIAQGGRDYQVTEVDFAAWKQALAGRTNVAFKLYPNLNHLFEPGTGKSTPAEYDTPSNVDPQVVSDIADWILKPVPPPLPK